MKTGQGPMGVAPKLLPFILPPLGLAIEAQFLAGRLVAFSGPFRGIAFAAGMVWTVFGLVFYADLAVRLVLALRRKTLATRGTYAFCRHPLFAWWIFFVFPSAALLLDNAFFLLCSFAALAAVARYAKEEEAWLEEMFGGEYRDYRGRTRFILPVPMLTGSRGLAFARFVLFCAAVGFFALALWFAAVSPVMVTFGTTAAERAAVWPGDDWAGGDAVGFTQAVTIRAPPEAVWPWLVQVGYKRAGWYNFDVINALAGPGYFIDGRGSSRRIVPELQDLAVGDEIFLAPGLGFRVELLEQDRTILLLAGDPRMVAAVNAGASMPAGYAATSWLFSLRELEGGGTRLVSRFRGRNASAGPLGDFLWNLIGGIGGAVVQQPAMFAGLRARAEGRTAR